MFFSAHVCNFDFILETSNSWVFCCWHYASLMRLSCFSVSAGKGISELTALLKPSGERS